MGPDSDEKINVTEPQNDISGSSSVDVENLDIKNDEGEEAAVLTPEMEMQNLLNESQAQAAEYLEGWQRARAEFANAKKRLERQRGEAHQNAASDFAQKLLPILDDFNRAIDLVPDEIAEDSWYEGIAMVQKKLFGFLEILRIESIEAVGIQFDPNIHEALALVEAEDVESGVVVEEIQVGYRIGERVIRPSLVNVAA